MFRVSFTPDKFGYYDVGGVKTYSKLEAIELQKSTNQFPEWHFNREVLDTVNWTKEPAVDLWELYKARARQIRNSFDYVVLFYSGGSDSFNMIDSWISADCKIDEIATWCNDKASRNKQDLMNSEIYLAALPEIKRFSNRADFNFRLIDISDLTAKISAQEDLLYLYSSVFSPHRMAAAHLRQHVKEYADLIAQGKKLCFVWGKDKPQMFYDERGHYVQFFDINDDCVSALSQINYHQGWYDELFYWTPDMPEITIKQAHILKRFLDNCHDPRYYMDDRGPFGYNPKINKHLSSHTLRRLIYPTWNPNTFISGKTPNKIFSVRDQWLWDSNLEYKDRTKSQILLFLDSVGDYWLNDPNNKFKGVKRHASPRYYI
jgi:hypothetical protein